MDFHQRQMSNDVQLNAVNFERFVQFFGGSNHEDGSVFGCFVNAEDHMAHA